MRKVYDKELSLTFAGIYLTNGKTIYRASDLNFDAISKEKGIEQLRDYEIMNTYKGQFHKAIIFDNRTKQALEKYNQHGFLIEKYD